MSPFGIDLTIAGQNLLAHRRRTAFLGAAVATVTCLFVLLTSLSAGIQRTMIDTTVTLASGHLNVGGYFKVTANRATPIVSEERRVMEIVKRAVPETDYVVSRGRGWGKIVADGASMQVALNGVEIASEPALRNLLQVAQGNLKDLEQPGALAIFEKQARTLNLSVGDAATLTAETSRGFANTLDCHVVAILRDVGLLSSWIAFMPNESLGKLLQLRPDVSGVLQLHLKPEYTDQLGPIADRLRRVLTEAGFRVMKPESRVYFEKQEAVERQGWTGQKLDVTSWQDEVSFLMWSYRALQGLSSVLIVLLLGITIAGITNTLWIATRERTREIGTLRAIGMQRFEVGRLFLLEASLLGLFGGLAGVLVGAASIQLLNAAGIHVPMSVQLFLMRDTLKLCLEFRTVAFGVLLMLAATSAAGFWPALRAAQQGPVNAMTHFG